MFCCLATRWRNASDRGAVQEVLTKFNSEFKVKLNSATVLNIRMLRHILAFKA